MMTVPSCGGSQGTLAYEFAASRFNPRFEMLLVHASYLLVALSG